MSWKRIALLVWLLVLIAIWQLDSASVVNRVWAAVLLVVYGGLALRALAPLATQSAAGPVDFLVAFATETGTARKLASKTAGHLRKFGFTVAIIELNALRNQAAPGRGVLVIASTTGQGDAPGTGAEWLADGGLPEGFARCGHGILALGDRSYPQFCGFGYVVAQAFAELGCSRYWDMIQVHQEDPQSIRYWFEQLDSLANREPQVSTGSRMGEIGP